MALPALLLVTAGLGVTSPVRQAYLHQLVPSEQRATVVSFDSMVSGAGGVGAQVGLGAFGEARSVSSAFVLGGLATAGGIPLFAAVRRIGGRADEIAGSRGGVESSCPHGLPAVATVDAVAIDELEPAIAASA